METFGMCELFEAQGNCGESCPAFKLNDPEQLQRAIDWVNTPSGPYLDAKGNDTSGVNMSYQDAILRCSRQIMRGACATPVKIK
jgi:hypothetical protein